MSDIGFAWHEALYNAYIIVSNQVVSNYFLIIIGVIVAGLVKLLLGPGRKRKLTLEERTTKALPHLQPATFLSGNEVEFFNRLGRALPTCHVFPQVSFSALLRVKDGRAGKEFYAVFDQYCKLRADYVICDKATLAIKAVIELDDVSHRGKEDKDAQRDRMLQEVGYKVVRFDSRNKPTEAQIAEALSF